MKKETQFQSLWGPLKAAIMGKFVTTNLNIETESSPTNNFKELESQSYSNQNL